MTPGSIGCSRTTSRRAKPCMSPAIGVLPAASLAWRKLNCIALRLQALASPEAHIKMCRIRLLAFLGLLGPCLVGRRLTSRSC